MSSFVDSSNLSHTITTTSKCVTDGSISKNTSKIIRGKKATYISKMSHKTKAKVRGKHQNKSRIKLRFVSSSLFLTHSK